ncbi:hypothetical protein PP7435_CHR2-0186 [Komagataella phaffii CBS 7435]|uniref:NmrA-like domain-containing protein n=2 Tax=Komagataella phaffii TaxID=460519 RepID=C4R2L9_KOMPG|nr:uncharacterized protein PAS_chr2-2_0470 [Komagataella phaffii GS115]AOA63092.1 GQ67_01162T0 [Komagataella phaffii]CAH2447702.1 hypothetical protein BQ9382_C2-1030 [Komagataella phaffii CBS 7435]AOA67792.1 GQ68_00227T0 [Komagataella phaffii GS115]CAY69743.1 hypothetical protein PAS_chr2-2_0470 [Komagataella phaffii GS115]CCA37883.1 hypothetical protein PP7435_CHR2-0186 [Komagataella phaffii CBS 7435]
MTTVAIIGAHSVLFEPIVKALKQASNVKFPIRAVTRKIGPSEVSDDKVKYYEATADDDKTYDPVLTGTDVIINLTPPSVEESKYNSILKSIERVGVKNFKFYIPSQFGVELSEFPFRPLVYIKQQHSEKARKLGLKTVDVFNSYFVNKGGFLDTILAHLGYQGDNKVIIRGDPDQLFNVSHVDDIGLSIASLIDNVDKASIPDTLRIYSDRVSQKEFYDAYEKRHNVKLERSYESKEEALRKATEKLNSGFKPADFLYYLNVGVSQSPEGGFAFKGDGRDIVNPGEKYFKWRKFANFYD